MRNTVAAGKGEKLMRSVVGGRSSPVGVRVLVSRRPRALVIARYRNPHFTGDALYVGTYVLSSIDF